MIGVPHPVAGEIVKAFVALKPGFAASDALRDELLAHARKKLGPAVAPREIAFAPSSRARAAARSCGACCARASSACPRATPSTLEASA